MVYRIAKGPDKMRRLRLGDKLLRVRDEPEPPPNPEHSAAPLVCIHGAGMSSVVWMDLLRRFAPGRRVVAPDLPGHAQSDRWHDAISLPGYADAVGTVCATLKIGRALLVGHSMGAGIALLCALAWPERVAGLILLNGAARLTVPDEVMAHLKRCLATNPDAANAAGDPNDRNERIDRLPPEFGELMFSPATPADLRDRWQAVLFNATRSVIEADFAACRDFDVREKLAEKKLSMKALVISGRDDLLVPPELGEETAALIPGATQVVIAGSGHLSLLEQPAECFAHIETFAHANR